MNKTSIEYLTHTWNPLAMRCTPVSQGCTNCWHLTMADRLAANPTISAHARMAYAGKCAPLLIQKRLTAPLRRKKPATIGVQFMGDLLHEDVPTHVIRSVLTVVALAPQHTFLILTKRSQRMKELLGSRKFRGELRYAHRSNALRRGLPDPADSDVWDDPSFPLPTNIIGMVTVEDQEQADKRIPDLLATPLAVRGLSAEPLLGAIDMSKWIFIGPSNRGLGPGPIKTYSPLGWVIVGGEAGPGARPMHPDWAREIKHQCQAANIPYFFKGWGAWVPSGQSENQSLLSSATKCWLDIRGQSNPTYSAMMHEPVALYRVGKKCSGHLLDGREHREFPQERL